MPAIEAHSVERCSVRYQEIRCRTAEHVEGCRQELIQEMATGAHISAAIVHCILGCEQNMVCIRSLS